MKSIKEISNIIPISYKDKEIIFLSSEYLNNYLNILTSPWYNRYMDFSFTNDISRKNLRRSLKVLIDGYSELIPNTYEVRLLLINKYTKTVIGGCSLNEHEPFNTIEISYFVLPEFQHMGIAKEMIGKLISTLRNSNIPYKEIEAVIMQSNTASINMCKALGFEERGRFLGKHTTNIRLGLAR